MWLDYDDKYAVSEEGLIMHKELGWITKGVVSENGYLRHSYNESGKSNYRLVQRMVAHLYLPKIDIPGLEVDHINHDRSDNRACNLRWCSGSVNRRNRNMKLPPTGEKYIRKTKYETWRLHIRFDGVNYFKTYNTLEEAIQARDKILTEYISPE